MRKCCPVLVKRLFVCCSLQPALARLAPSCFLFNRVHITEACYPQWTDWPCHILTSCKCFRLELLEDMQESQLQTFSVADFYILLRMLNSPFLIDNHSHHGKHPAAGPKVVNLSISTNINTNPETKTAKCSCTNTDPPASPQTRRTDTTDNRPFVCSINFAAVPDCFLFFLTKYFSER